MIRTLVLATALLAGCGAAVDPGSASTAAPVADETPPESVPSPSEEEGPATAEETSAGEGGTPSAEATTPTPTPTAAALAPDCADVAHVAVEPGPRSAADPGEVQRWALDAAPGAFGGLWIDRDAGGITAVAFAEDVERWRDQVHERFGDDIRVVAVRFPQVELEQLQREIGGRMNAEDARSPGGINSLWIDVRRNRVGIGIVAPSDADRAELTEAYGAARICLDPIPIPDEDDAEIAGWAPVDPGSLTSGSTRIPIEVMERSCADGRSADGRIAPPEIVYGDDAVVVTVRVIPVAGGATCPSNPPTPYTLELEEPLGDRALLDGATDPPREPQLER